MRKEDIFPSKYLRCGDLEGAAHLYTITREAMEELRNERGVETKLVLYFKETEQALVVNVTNFDIMAEFLGPDTNDWMGKQIVLYPEQVQFGNKRVPAIRVRAPKKQASGGNKHTTTNRGDYDIMESPSHGGVELDETF